MSFQFGGNNPYQSQSAKEELFLKKKGLTPFDFKFEQPKEEVSLFDITTESDLNDTGKKFTSNDFLGNVAPNPFDGTNWLGLTGKGAMGDETPLMRASFLEGPPPQDKDKPQNPDLDWSWNTFA